MNHKTQNGTVVICYKLCVKLEKRDEVQNPIQFSQIKEYLLSQNYNLTQQDFQLIFNSRCNDLKRYLLDDLSPLFTYNQAKSLLDGTGLKTRKGLIKKIRFCQEVVEAVFNEISENEYNKFRDKKCNKIISKSTHFPTCNKNDEKFNAIFHSKESNICKYDNEYCRSWNIVFQKICCFNHTHTIKDFPLRSYIDQDIKYIDLKKGDAVYDYLKQKFIGSWVQNSTKPKILSIKQVISKRIEYEFNKKKKEMAKKTIRADTTELYHGTCEANFKTIFEKGFIPPSDFEIHPLCPDSGHLYGKLSTSICSKLCKLCTSNKHHWNKCHMFGLGVYFASNSSKSDQYVSDKKGNKNCITRKMLVCSVLLGNSEVVKSLQKPDEMHNRLLPKSGYHSIYAVGWKEKLVPTTLSGDALGVINDEYIIFHPQQALPLYIIKYKKIYQ